MVRIHRRKPFMRLQIDEASIRRTMGRIDTDVDRAVKEALREEADFLVSRVQRLIVEKMMPTWGYDTRHSPMNVIPTIRWTMIRRYKGRGWMTTIESKHQWMRAIEFGVPSHNIPVRRPVSFTTRRGDRVSISMKTILQNNGLLIFKADRKWHAPPFHIFRTARRRWNVVSFENRLKRKVKRRLG